MCDRDCSDCDHFFVDDLFNEPGCKLKHFWFNRSWLLDDFPEANDCAYFEIRLANKEV